MNLQITKSGVVFSGNEKYLKLLQREFSQNHGIRLQKFIEPSLLKQIQRQINTAEFKLMENYGAEDYMLNNTTEGLLHFLLNDKKLFKILEQITGCEPIGSLEGRIYRLSPNSGHYDRWHSDIEGHRLFTISINLSTEVYEGGILQLRDRNSKKILTRLPNVGLGDAIIFKISKNLQHKLSNMTGTTSKIAFAGWFSSKPNYESALKMIPAQKRKKIVLRETKPLEFNSTIKINKNVFYRTLDENTVIFNLKTGFSCGLQSTGDMLWRLLIKEKKLKTIFNLMKDEYNVSPTILKRDIFHAIDQLCSNEIVEVVN